MSLEQDILVDNDSSFFDGMTETVPPSIPVSENPPVLDSIQALRGEVAELRAILAPIGPFIDQLPELAEKIGPLIDGLKKSPVLKMLGVSL